MNDNSVLGAVRDSLTAAKGTLTDTHMSTPLDTIVQRGRAARRRHRLIGLAGTAAVAASAALVVGLTAVAGSVSAPSTGAIRTEAFTLVSNANGTVTLTINLNELLDAAALQNDLQHDGIPAIVNSGSFCSSDPAPAGFLQVVSFSPSPTLGRFTTIPPGVHPTITFNPSAMPAGTELSFGVFRFSSGEQQADFVLINSSSYTCTATRPLALDHGAQFQTGTGSTSATNRYTVSRTPRT
jgi:hypothetical protein